MVRLSGGAAACAIGLSFEYDSRESERRRRSHPQVSLGEVATVSLRIADPQRGWKALPRLPIITQPALVGR